ncbi:uncharacterized protein LOC128888610 [Hylaeus anthracinus]|uniref:uncharacterized protein LOC128888610 n=1 Tax=Hylaeus anthracinus TaxID=313031 RepID=UPI0023B9C11E|nr:uncharacterized protein LOC128888610 [Hylaeus anthracinus]XP_054001617.1 uncharacterized protein LOC128888610 [Hylaeus anthracinus]
MKQKRWREIHTRVKYTTGIRWTKNTKATARFQENQKNKQLKIGKKTNITEQDIQPLLDWIKESKIEDFIMNKINRNRRFQHPKRIDKDDEGYWKIRKEHRQIKIDKGPEYSRQNLPKYSPANTMDKEKYSFEKQEKVRDIYRFGKTYERTRQDNRDTQRFLKNTDVVEARASTSKQTDEEEWRQTMVKGYFNNVDKQVPCMSEEHWEDTQEKNTETTKEVAIIILETQKDIEIDMETMEEIQQEKQVTTDGASLLIVNTEEEIEPKKQDIEAKVEEDSMEAVEKKNVYPDGGTSWEEQAEESG